jgi:hypothetical protein
VRSLCPHCLPPPSLDVSQAGLGKTWLLNTIASCHAAAALPPQLAESHGVTPVLDRGFIKGRALRDDYRFARVPLLRLRDVRLEGDGTPFILPGATVEMAVAAAVVRILGAPPAVCDASPADLANALFGSVVAAQTLWLLDGFDEVPDARSLAAELAEALKAAFADVRTRSLPAPRDAEAERAFRRQAATSIPRGRRLYALLRVLLMQPHVVVSSRPQFEGDLAPFTGLASARFVRLEPLATQAVACFVEGALKVRLRCAAARGCRRAQPLCLSPRHDCHRTTLLAWSESISAWRTTLPCSKPCALRC